MPPRKVQRDYNFAATDFYLAGRTAQAAGEDRDNNASPSNPNNAAAWEQSYKTDPALTGDPLAAKYGAVDYHYWFGWDDAKAGWPDRTWQASLSRGAYRPPINFDGKTRTRLWWLYWLYTSSWMGSIGPTYTAGSLLGAEDFLTPLEIQWEIEQARKDKAAGTTPPLFGYREPGDAGVPAKGAPPVPVTKPPERERDPDELYPGYDVEAVRRYRRRSVLPFGGIGFGRRGLADILPLFTFGRRR